ncbi:putative kinase inhibitor [Pirellulimonas nuda]|uniref:Putative kinase inhibitor n=1 Tax=Pirellulimonas nuda TaxID=2528009 RepID=A0A518DE26_9BACT|nr:YHYH protein [Pirellulimonas nuda]QDU89716.1 putative kinase inhibitor [Pirellulimonas nuda]
MRIVSFVCLLALGACRAQAHEGHPHPPSPERTQQIMQLNAQPQQQPAQQQPGLAKMFEPFSGKVRVRSDHDFLFVESSGIPDHRMMVGITAWQQQVPLPQTYVGENAWRIPLNPVPAQSPKTTKGEFLRGAIALAANGVPIFNPLNNRGEDAYLFGELDEFGGHCGRADDYHYHLAPVHLQNAVGEGTPIAVALDGYPIYGYTEPDGSPVEGLDRFNGHDDPRLGYHYHATRAYPYLNGGFHGEVTERDGQVDPQPRANPLRPALEPLRGAKITQFVESEQGGFLLTYQLDGRQGTVGYTLAADGSAAFEFVDTNGRKTKQTYTPHGPGAGGGGRRPEPPAPPRRPRPVGRAPGPPAQGAQQQRPGALSELQVSSSDVDADGRIKIDCTCDGAGVPPAVRWGRAPQGTKAFALSLWHTAPDQEKSYWVVFNIPAETTELARGSSKVGVWGLNDKRRHAYDPMCSKGPGVKTYCLTVFALSQEVDLPADTADRAGLLAAIRGATLAEGTLEFTYER